MLFYRDFRDSEYVQVVIFKNRFKIRNPGSLYDGLTIEDLRERNISKRWNPLVAKLLLRINYVESWGHGMPLIL
ncbi:MAG: hypothetical protein EXS67_04910 [Candidatus Margulisbacteria bacterium]|nr:hypothetical protein [Candidatus Margulisiibacteriota bacterium]